MLRPNKPPRPSNCLLVHAAHFLHRAVAGLPLPVACHPLQPACCPCSTSSFTAGPAQCRPCRRAARPPAPRPPPPRPSWPPWCRRCRRRGRQCRRRTQLRGWGGAKGVTAMLGEGDPGQMHAQRQAAGQAAKRGCAAGGVLGGWRTRVVGAVLKRLHVGRMRGRIGLGHHLPRLPSSAWAVGELMLGGETSRGGRDEPAMLTLFKSPQDLYSWCADPTVRAPGLLVATASPT
jgi:hypothetical protein